jgi:formylglycine-generating enzyme required for sulfatase activity
MTNSSVPEGDDRKAVSTPSGDIPETKIPQQALETTHSRPSPGEEFLLKSGARPIPEYELRERLGAGGYGEVWKAHGPGGIPVALKFIRLGDKAGDVELRALEVMRDVRHPHLLGLLGAWQSHGFLIIALELADRTLYQRLKQAQGELEPGIPRPELLGYMREAAEALDHLNSLGIQHRDVKPHNILLVGGGVKVGDFGLAKMLANRSASNTGMLTPLYAAPEFFQGRTSDRSDQYSLAVSYCQLRGGRLPFEGGSPQLLYAHLQKPPDLTMLPEEERPPVARALSKVPEQRWPSCRAFVAELEDSGPPPQPSSSPTKGNKAILTGMVVLPLLVGLGVLLWLSDRSQRPGPSIPEADPEAEVANRSIDGGNPGTSEAPPQSALTPPLRSEGEGQKPANAPLPRDVTNSIGMRVVLILPGKFVMGSPESEKGRNDDEDAHEVEITRPFYLGAFEVTQEEYLRVQGKNPSQFAPGPAGGSQVEKSENRLPVENVSWNLAVEFCQRLSSLPEEKRERRIYRLPTEAEWEYSCRAGTTTPYHTGASLIATQANCLGSRTTPVGSFPPNAWGLYDMHGNVWEWCQDWYEPNFYQKSPRQDPRGPDEGEGRVLRGGSWLSTVSSCRAAYRSAFDAKVQSPTRGFRVVLEVRSHSP